MAQAGPIFRDSKAKSASPDRQRSDQTSLGYPRADDEIWLVIVGSDRHMPRQQRDVVERRCSRRELIRIAEKLVDLVRIQPECLVIRNLAAGVRINRRLADVRYFNVQAAVPVIGPDARAVEGKAVPRLRAVLALGDGRHRGALLLRGHFGLRGHGPTGPASTMP